MAAPKGNRFWEARTKHGRDKLFASDDALWEACCEYFEWVELNPILEEKAFPYQGGVIKDNVTKMRAMTLDGLCTFLEMDVSTWSAWRKRDDFSHVVRKVERIIRDQKFTGAAAGQLNSNIIARDLGLADRQEIKQTSRVQVSADMTPQDAARAYQDLMNEE